MDFPEGINKVVILINAGNSSFFCLSLNAPVKSSASGSSFVTKMANNGNSVGITVDEYSLHSCVEAGHV